MAAAVALWLAAPAGAARIGLNPLMGDGAAGRTTVLSGVCFEANTTYTVRIAGFAVNPATVVSTAAGVINNTTLTLPDLPRGNLDVMLASATFTRSFTGAFRVWPNICLSPVRGEGRFGETWETNAAIPTGGWVGMVVMIQGWGFASGVTIAANSITVGGVATTHPAITVSAGGRFQSATQSTTIIVSSNLPNGFKDIVINDGAANTFTSAYEVRRSIALSPARGYGVLGSTIFIEGWGFAPGNTGAITIGASTVTPNTLAVAADGSFAGTITLQGNPGGGRTPVTTGQENFPNCYNDTARLNEQIGIYPVTPTGPPNQAIRIEGMGNWAAGTIAANSSKVQVPGGDVPTVHSAITVANGRFPRTWIRATDSIELNAQGVTIIDPAGLTQTNQAFYTRRNLAECPVYSSGVAGFTTTITGWSFSQSGPIAANSITVGGYATTHAAAVVDLYGEWGPRPVALPALPNGDLSVVVNDGVATTFLQLLAVRRTIGLSYVVGPGLAGDVTNIVGNGFVAGAIGGNSITFGGIAVTHGAIAVAANGSFASTALTLPAFADGPYAVVAQGGEAFPQAYRSAKAVLTVVKTQIPASPGIGETVAYRVVVTSTGGAMLTTLMLADTLSPVVMGATASEPSGFPTPVVTSVAGTGTRFVWSSAAAGLGQGQSFTFTITGAMGFVCANTAASNTAFATGSDGCGAVGTSAASMVGSVVAPPLLSVQAQKTITGGGWVGQAISYSIAVRNVGSATITSLLVTDTVSPVVVGATAGTPAGWAAPTVTSVAGTGTIFAWTGAGLTFYPGTTTTFTISGSVGVVCAATAISNTGYIVATSACSTTVVATNAVGVVVPPPVTGLTVVKQLVPASPGIGGPVTYRLVVTNSGTATITSLLVTDTVSPVVMSATASEPSGFPTPVVTSVAGTGTLFVWSSAAANLGLGQAFTFTVTGAVGMVCATTAVSNTAFVSGAGVCSTTAMTTNLTGFTVAPPLLSVQVQKTLTGGGWVGQAISYSIAVRNVGSATITSLLVVDTVSAVVVGATAGTPAGWAAPAVTSVAGSGTIFTWTGAGLTFYPGTTTTFTISGSVGVVCAATAISNTGYIVATSACSTTVLATNAVGVVVPAVTTALTVVKTQTPASPGTGAAVAYRIVVTNTGTATITSLLVTDTVSPVVMSATASEPSGYPTPVVTSVAGAGTLFVWSSAAANLGVGQAFTFTVTGTVGFVCASTSVSNTAFVSGTGVCSTTVMATNVTGFTVAAPLLSVQVQKTITGGGWVGQAISYSIAVRNVGSATITSLLVVDTVSAVVVGATAGTPAGWAAPTVTSVAGTGTIYAWTGTGLSFYPGTTTTFTISGSVGVVCAATAISNTGYVVATSACSTTVVATNAVGMVVPGVVTNLTVTKIQTPASPGTGAAVTYRIVVTNTGTATITSLLVTDTVSPVVMSATASEPSGFPTPVVTSVAGTGTRFVWSSGAANLGLGQAFTFTVTGAVGFTCATTAVSNTAFVSGTGVCSTTVMATNVTGFTVAAPLLSVQVQKTITGGGWVGQAVNYSIAVRNVGSATITSLLVTDTVSPVVVGATAGTPAGWAVPTVTSVAGTGTIYAWTGTGLSFYPGTTTTFTISGSVGVVCAATAISNTGYVVATSACSTTVLATNAVGVVVPAPTTSLAVVKTHSPLHPVNGGTVTFSIIVTNTGTATITNLRIVDTLSGNVTFNSQTSNPAIAWNANPSIVGWAGAVSISPNASATVTVTATNSSGFVGWISNTVWVQSTTMCGSVQVAALDPGYQLAPPILTVVKTSNKSKGPPGTVVTYSIKLTNPKVAGGACGDSWMIAKGIVFQDTIPAGLAFNAGTLQLSTDNGGTFNPAANLGTPPLVAVTVPDLNEGDGDAACNAAKAVIVKFDVTVQ